MSAFALVTISDKEAADKLGFPVRVIRPVIDEHALCLRAGRSRRLTEAHFIRLQSILTPPCPSQPNLVRSASWGVFVLCSPHLRPDLRTTTLHKPLQGKGLC